MQCDGIEAFLGILIVAGIGPPGIDLDAMVLPNQVLDNVNTPCVIVNAVDLCSCLYHTTY